MIGAPACGGSTAGWVATDGGSAESAPGDSGYGADGATVDASAGDGSAPADGGDAGIPADGASAEASAGDGGLSPSCPSSAPADGSACTAANLACEYGDDLLMPCDTIATCTAGTWHVQPPVITACGGPTGTTDPGCPATSSAVPVGQACSPQMTCGYAGTVCYCYVDHTGAPQVWGCFPGTSGCPYPRPRVGSPCTTGGLECDYSACGDSIACTGGLWTLGNGGCHP